MTSINSITLEVADFAVAESFYAAAFDLGGRLQLKASDAPSTGFRGYTLSLLVSQPGNATAVFDSAVAAGATVLKPAEKSMWGFGGVVQAPDGAIWKVATNVKKDTAAVTAEIDSVVLLLGAEDVGVSKRFYTEHGLTVGRSFGSYVDFDMKASPITLGLYKRKALAKDAGVLEAGTGSHRLLIGSDSRAFTDPDGFVWEPAKA